MMPVRIFHVLPRDIARGAQRYARALRDSLDGREGEHRILTIFRSDAAGQVMNADIRLDEAPLGAFAPRAAWALSAALRRTRPDVVVAHGSEPLKYLAAAAPPRLPVVYYKIGVAHREARQAGRRTLHGLLLRRAARLAGVSGACIDEAADCFGFPRSRTVLIPNGRDPTVFRPWSGDRWQRPVVTFVGSLSETKRPLRFVELVERLREAGFAFDAQIAGEGPLEGALRPRAARAGVQMLGRQDDIPKLLSCSDVFVFTSVPEGEGMPGVLIEAGLAGLPVVSTTVPGAADVVRHESTGFLVAPDDFDGLCRGVSSLLESSTLRTEMGRRARDFCVQEFTLERSVARWERLLEDVAQGVRIP